MIHLSTPIHHRILLLATIRLLVVHKHHRNKRSATTLKTFTLPAKTYFQVRNLNTTARKIQTTVAASEQLQTDQIQCKLVAISISIFKKFRIIALNNSLDF
jgi:hypothetical protein